MRTAFGEAIILAGERGGGKTSACREAARLATLAGLSVGGVISPSRRDSQGRPLEIEVESLSTGERAPLASRSGPATAPFDFSEEGFAWSLALLRAESDSDLLVVDEVGPLELETGSGFRPFLDELARGLSLGAPGLLLVTVRPSLAEPLALLLASAGTVLATSAVSILRLDESTRASLPGTIAAHALAIRNEKNLAGPKKKTP
jgi:nucleoside-triphosphatase THEP1